MDSTEKLFDELQKRGILSEVLPSTEGLITLMQKKRINFYIGIDATGESMHLGHAQNIMVLERLRRLGHNVTLLFGDFTALIGDPSDKDEVRVRLTKEVIKKNIEKWKKQCSPILKMGRFEKNYAKIKYNSSWLSTLKMEKLFEIASQFTVQQILERDMFEKRIKSGKAVYLHEFMYPLMQGYDSVAMDIDVELCGSDQTFNALAGRTLVKRYLKKEKFVFSLNLISNPKTGVLMSKSKGTGILLNDTASGLFGQIMSQPDEMVEVLFKRCTEVPLDELDIILQMHPKDSKTKLALEVVSIFYGEENGKKAKDSFNKQFKQNTLPDDVKEIKILKQNILDVLIETELASSKGEAKRKLAEGSVYIDGKKIQNPEYDIAEGSLQIKLGKKMIKIHR